MEARMIRLRHLIPTALLINLSVAGAIVLSLAVSAPAQGRKVERRESKAERKDKKETEKADLKDEKGRRKEDLKDTKQERKEDKKDLKEDRKDSKEDRKARSKALKGRKN